MRGTHDKTLTIHEKSLDCTFCGMLYYLLAIKPENVEDWQGVHYRSCCQCATGANENYIWHSEYSNLSRAILFLQACLDNR